MKRRNPLPNSWARLLAALVSLALLASACGDPEPDEAEAQDGLDITYPTEEPLEVDPASTNATADACVTPPDGLVGWWTLDDDTFADKVTGSPDRAGQPVGTVTTTSAMVGDGGDFTAGHLAVDDPIALGLGDFTIDAWVDVPSSLRDVPIVEARVSSDGKAFVDGYLFMTRGNELLVQIYDATTGHRNWTSSGVGLTPGWHFVAVSVDRDGDITFTVDDTHVTSATNGAKSDTVLDPQTLVLGGDVSNTGGRYELAMTEIDEIEIFDRALGTDELQSIHEAGPAGKCKQPVTLTCAIERADLPADLVAWWPFDSVNGAGVELSQYSPGTTYSYADHAMVAAIPSLAIGSGMVSGALDARGIGTYATAPLRTASDAVDFGSDVDFSIDAWVRFDDSDGTSAVTERIIPAVDQELDAARRLDTFLAHAVTSEGEEYALSSEDLGLLSNVDARAEIIMEAAAAGGDPRLPVPLAVPQDEVNGYVIAEHGFAEGDGWALYANDQGELTFAQSYMDAGTWTSVKSVSNATSLLDGEWHLIALTVDQTPTVDPAGSTTADYQGSFYLDGAQIGHSSAGADLSFTNTAPVTIGALQSQSNFFDEWPGFIDEVEIFNTELTDDFVLDLYNAGNEGKCKPEIVTEVVCQADVALEWNSFGPTPRAEDMDLVIDGVHQPHGGTRQHYNYDQSTFVGDTAVDPHSEWNGLNGNMQSSWSVEVVAEDFDTNNTYDWMLTASSQTITTKVTAGGSTTVPGPVTSWTETGTYVDTDDEFGDDQDFGPYVVDCNGDDNPPPTYTVTCAVTNPTNYVANVGDPVTVKATVTPAAPTGMVFEFDMDDPNSPAASSNATIFHSYTTGGGKGIGLTWTAPDGQIGTVGCGGVEIIETEPVRVECGIEPAGTLLPNQDFRAFTIPAQIADWNMGDSTTFQSTDTVQHAYSQPGTYIVSVIINGTSYPCAEVLVEGEVIVEYDVSCSVSPTSIVLGEPVTVTISSTPANPNATFSVDMGDGNVLTVGPGSHSHTYTSGNPGSPVVSFTGLNTSGGCGQVSISVPALPALAAGCIIEGAGQGPVSFDYNGDGIIDEVWASGTGTTVALIQTVNTNAANTTYTWSFTETAGTGNTIADQTGENVQVTFPDGIFMITLTATSGSQTASAICWHEAG